MPDVRIGIFPFQAKSSQVGPSIRLEELFGANHPAHPAGWGIQGLLTRLHRGVISRRRTPGLQRLDWGIFRPMMTDRIRSFLNERRPEGPCLVVDLEVVRKNYEAFARVLPDSRIFYAVKANPAPEVLSLLASLGSSFDAASVNEIEMVLGDRRRRRAGSPTAIRSRRNATLPVRTRSAFRSSRSTASRRSRRFPGPRPAPASSAAS